MYVQTDLLKVTPHMAYMDAVKSSGQLHMICRGVFRTASMYRASVESLRRLVTPMFDLVVDNCTIDLVGEPGEVFATKGLRDDVELRCEPNRGDYISLCSGQITESSQ
jgi:hypothetical protein